MLRHAADSREDRIVLTFDLDFGDLAALAGSAPARIILFRLHNTRPAQGIDRLGAVLDGSREALARGVVILAEDARHRIRYLPIGEASA